MNSKNLDIFVSNLNGIPDSVKEGTDDRELWYLYNQREGYKPYPEIPKRYESVSYDDVDSRIKELFAEMFKTKKGIYIHGPVGTGKTHTLFALQKYYTQNRKDKFKQLDEIRSLEHREYVVEGNTRKETIHDDIVAKKVKGIQKIGHIDPIVRVQNMTSLLFDVKQSFAKKDNDFLDKVLNSKKILMIDDIGAEKVTDWVEEFVYMLVNNRYEDCVPTCFSSNLPLSELAEKIGDRTVSRIKEMCHVVKLDGEDKRLSK
jgi:DNA replication protein DnaC